jgi:hypothetical protein
MCIREMLPDFGSMHAAVIFDPCDVKRSAVCLFPTLHGPRTQFLKIQPVAEPYPSNRVAIPDKNFELGELKF